MPPIDIPTPSTLGINGPELPALNTETLDLDAPIIPEPLPFEADNIAFSQTSNATPIDPRASSVLREDSDSGLGSSFAQQSDTGPTSSASSGSPTEPNSDLSDEFDLPLLQGLAAQGITLEDIVTVGMKALSGASFSPPTIAVRPGSNSLFKYQGGEEQCISPQNRKALFLVNSLPDVYRNTIRVKQLAFVTACLTNARVIGLEVGAIYREDLASPFFRGSISKKEADEACATGFKNMKPSLRPNASQLMIEHHPYMDILPFPTMRDRLLRLTAGDEPMIDEDDFCNDLANDGLICWGSSLGGGSSATGSGAPWDLRSWEAQPWFIKKWWILIGGAEGELYQQTKWWCEMRGDTSTYPW